MDNGGFIFVDESQLVSLNAGVLTSNHRSVLKVRTLSVHDSVLVRVEDSEFFAVLGPIELDQRSSIATVESRVVSSTEFVELVDKVRMVVSERAECNGEFSFLLLEVHQSPVERRDDVVKACSENSGIHFSFVTLVLEFRFFFEVEFFVFT